MGVNYLFTISPSDPSALGKRDLLKNHEYIRYILPKGTSFAGLTQDDCYLIASHINSTSRLSLNNFSPYQSALLFIGEDNMNKFQIKKINIIIVDLTIRLLKK